MSDPDSLEVNVRLHAILRHRNGQVVNQLTLRLSPGSCVQDALNALRLPAGVEVIPALNGRVVAEDTPLASGDDLAVLPEIGGG